MSGGSRKAAKILKTTNSELAIELEELADELEETHERFGMCLHHQNIPSGLSTHLIP